MKTRHIAIALVSTIAVSAVVLYMLRRNREEKKLIDVADAGYETAHDILYPLQTRKSKRHYGLN